MEKISNGKISASVSSHGAELCSITKDGVEYLWQADPLFWKRHSPVLFPIVGGLRNGVYRCNGTEYRMSQHGFARDMDFVLEEQSDFGVRYRLTSTEDTKKVYPFDFDLQIAYSLEGNNVKVSWSVRNTGDREMLFQIGAHPAFFYPGFNASDRCHGYFSFEKDGLPVSDLDYILIGESGCADTDVLHRMHLANGMLPLSEDTFDRDALIVENGQVDKVVLRDVDGKPWLGLSFDAPLVGLWSPPSKNAPFVCIEPWYGRCDRTGFSGEMKDRDWMFSLEPGGSFDTSYLINIY